MRNLRYGIESGKILIGKIKRNESSLFFSLIFAHSLNICAEQTDYCIWNINWSFVLLLEYSSKNVYLFESARWSMQLKFWKKDEEKMDLTRNWE